MGKFMICASYTADGVKGVIAKGGTARRDAVEKAVAGVGGTVESFHFAFGEDDVFVVADMPDNISAAAVGLAVSATGMVRARTLVLLTPEEVDRAAQVQVGYTPPGS